MEKKITRSCTLPWKVLWKLLMTENCVGAVRALNATEKVWSPARANVAGGLLNFFLGKIKIF